MARIYIETTVISFYFNVRTEPEMVARENWTRRWLDAALAGNDELVTSLAVKSELDGGEFPNKSDIAGSGFSASIAGLERRSRRGGRCVHCAARHAP